MENLPLTHPLERRLIGVTLLAFLVIIFWKAGEPPHQFRLFHPTVQSP